MAVFRALSRNKFHMPEGDDVPSSDASESDEERRAREEAEREQSQENQIKATLKLTEAEKHRQKIRDVIQKILQQTDEQAVKGKQQGFYLKKLKDGEQLVSWSIKDRKEMDESNNTFRGNGLFGFTLHKTRKDDKTDTRSKEKSFTVNETEDGLEFTGDYKSISKFITRFSKEMGVEAMKGFKAEFTSSTLDEMKNYIANLRNEGFPVSLIQSATFYYKDSNGNEKKADFGQLADPNWRNSIITGPEPSSVPRSAPQSRS